MVTVLPVPIDKGLLNKYYSRGIHCVERQLTGICEAFSTSLTSLSPPRLSSFLFQLLMGINHPCSLAPRKAGVMVSEHLTPHSPTRFHSTLFLSLSRNMTFTLLHALKEGRRCPCALECISWYIGLILDHELIFAAFDTRRTCSATNLEVLSAI